MVDIARMEELAENIAEQRRECGRLLANCSAYEPLPSVVVETLEAYVELDIAHAELHVVMGNEIKKLMKEMII